MYSSYNTTSKEEFENSTLVQYSYYTYSSYSCTVQVPQL